MIEFLLNHPYLFLFALPLVPVALAKIEKIAIARLLSEGDADDQALLRSVAQAVVLWAEKKGAQDGSGKFAVADKLVARALPFLSADQRRKLIQDAVDQMDKAAHEAIDGAGGPKTN